jgi:hypothetical protein
VPVGANGVAQPIIIEVAVTYEGRSLTAREVYSPPVAEIPSLFTAMHLANMKLADKIKSAGTAAAR